MNPFETISYTSYTIIQNLYEMKINVEKKNRLYLVNLTFWHVSNNN